jgi:zinc transport system substrate-binding protein
MRSKFGDSALNCRFAEFPYRSAVSRQLSALSPNLLRMLIVAALLASAVAARAEAPKVAASFKPIHSLVASVMQGAGDPYLIVKGAASPHDYAMTPSDAAALQEAEVVFWIGPDLEAFLQKPVEALGAKARIIALEDTDGLTKFASVESRGIDPHLWLDPVNAKLMVRRMEQALSKADPANAAAYRTNADKTAASLDALQAELAATLAPVKGRPFITFHDAFQYFEMRFGMEAAGSVTVNPDAPPGAARVAELRARVKDLGVKCVFAEPNFEPKIIDAVIEGTDAKVGRLDPEASGLTEGPELYFRSMRGIAQSMRECLG